MIAAWTQLGLQALVLLGGITGLYIALSNKVERINTKLAELRGALSKEIRDEVDKADTKHIERFHDRADPSGIIATHSEQ